MKSLPLPARTWQLVSQDICTHEQKEYLISVSHFSDWIEVNKLQDTLTATVISKTKALFGCFGIPQIWHTGNGPQFASKEYDDFATQYGLQCTTPRKWRSWSCCKSIQIDVKESWWPSNRTASLPKHPTPGSHFLACTAHALPKNKNYAANTRPLSALNELWANNTMTGQHLNLTVLCVSAPTSMWNHQQHKRVGPGYVLQSFHKTHLDPTRYKPWTTAFIRTVSTSSQQCHILIYLHLTALALCCQATSHTL